MESGRQHLSTYLLGIFVKVLFPFALFLPSVHPLGAPHTYISNERHFRSAYVEDLIVKNAYLHYLHRLITVQRRNHGRCR